MVPSPGMTVNVPDLFVFDKVLFPFHPEKGPIILALIYARSTQELEGSFRRHFLVIDPFSPGTENIYKGFLLAETNTACASDHYVEFFLFDFFREGIKNLSRTRRDSACCHPNRYLRIIRVKRLQALSFQRIQILSGLDLHHALLFILV